MIDLPPETRYVNRGGVHIAYQVVGDGPLDLVVVPGFVSHLDLFWEEGAESRHFQSRLAAFSRLILFDKRGTGLSDRNIGEPTLEERIDDVLAVMDAAGSERAALLGYSEGGPMSILFAATHPGRVSALILASTSARPSPAAGYPCGSDFAAVAPVISDMARERWGQGHSLELFAPELARNERARRGFGRWERLAASPSVVLSLVDLMSHLDVRSALAALHLPTLVINRHEDITLGPCHGRYLAKHIDDARLVEHPGGHILWLDGGPVLDDIEEFLTGSRRHHQPDRSLATVLFTDIVGSTDQARTLGDHRWRGLLDRHDELARVAVDRHRGRLVKTTGDGLLATFDGPARAIRCAWSIRDKVTELGLELRAGLHTGELEVRGDDVGGIAVHIAARVEAAAEAGEVLVSRTVKDLVTGSGISFMDRGTHALKGIPEEWQLYAVTGGELSGS